MLWIGKNISLPDLTEVLEIIPDYPANKIGDLLPQNLKLWSSRAELTKNRGVVGRMDTVNTRISSFVTNEQERLSHERGSLLLYSGSWDRILGEMLLSRYELFVSCRTLTHLTTSLSASEIESFNRILSRLREMFYLISFPSDSKDKRK